METMTAKAKCPVCLGSSIRDMQFNCVLICDSCVKSYDDAHKSVIDGTDTADNDSEG